jgi:hypothetical protein
MSNTTSLLVLQYKKCAVFEIFDQVFGTTPNARPVNPQEIGGEPSDDSQVEPNDGARPAANAVAPVRPAANAVAPVRSAANAVAPVRPAANAVAPVRPAAPVRPDANDVAQVAQVRADVTASVLQRMESATAATAATGRTPAAFHLAPSKKEKKMDLGEAYMKVGARSHSSTLPLSRSHSRSRSGLNLWRLQRNPSIAPILSSRSRCRARTLQRLRIFCSVQAFECLCACVCDVSCFVCCVFVMFHVCVCDQ